MNDHGCPAGVHQRGIALLVALLTVALAAILIAGLLDRGELAYARTRNALRAEQAQAYAHGLEAYAAEVLLKDLADDPGTDTNADVWTHPLPSEPVPGGFISATMRDLNGCFNLNNLAGNGSDHAEWVRMFRRLLLARGVDPGIADAVLAWLGGDAAAADTEDNFYLSLPVPYRSAQRMFAHVSELRLVRGVDGDVYARLAPYVCALPPGTKINVNTASVPVLQTFADGITQAQAESLWQNGQAHWPSNFRDAWRQQNVIVDGAINERMAGTVSTYFLARGDVVLDEIPFTFFSLIERGLGGARGGVRVLERSRGSDDVLTAPALPPADARPAGEPLAR